MNKIMKIFILLLLTNGLMQAMDSKKSAEPKKDARNQLAALKRPWLIPPIRQLICEYMPKEWRVIETPNISEMKSVSIYNDPRGITKLVTGGYTNFAIWSVNRENKLVQEIAQPVSSAIECVRCFQDKNKVRIATLGWNTHIVNMLQIWNRELQCKRAIPLDDKGYMRGALSTFTAVDGKPKCVTWSGTSVEIRDAASLATESEIKTDAEITDLVTTRLNNVPKIITAYKEGRIALIDPAKAAVENNDVANCGQDMRADALRMASTIATGPRRRAILADLSNGTIACATRLPNQLRICNLLNNTKNNGRELNIKKMAAFMDLDGKINIVAVMSNGAIRLGVNDLDRDRSLWNPSVPSRVALRFNDLNSQFMTPEPSVTTYDLVAEKTKAGNNLIAWVNNQCLGLACQDQPTDIDRAIMELEFDKPTAAISTNSNSNAT